MVIPSLGPPFLPPALALCPSVPSILFLSPACLPNNYFGILTTCQAWGEVEVRGETRLVDKHIHEGKVSGRETFYRQHHREMYVVGAFKLARSPPSLGPCHHTNVPSPNPLLVPMPWASSPSTLTLSCCSHNPAVPPNFRMNPLFYVASPRPLRRTPKTIVDEMDPTSLRSCPLSRSPALCPLWYSCGYSPSGRRDRAHVLDGVVR